MNVFQASACLFSLLCVREKASEVHASVIMTCCVCPAENVLGQSELYDMFERSRLKSMPLSLCCVCSTESVSGQRELYDNISERNRLKTTSVPSRCVCPTENVSGQNELYVSERSHIQAKASGQRRWVRVGIKLDDEISLRCLFTSCPQCHRVACVVVKMMKEMAACQQIQAEASQLQSWGGVKLQASVYMPET